jgi:hypothetical protein
MGTKPSQLRYSESMIHRRQTTLSRSLLNRHHWSMQICTPSSHSDNAAVMLWPLNPKELGSQICCWYRVSRTHFLALGGGSLAKFPRRAHQRSRAQENSLNHGKLQTDNRGKLSIMTSQERTFFQVLRARERVAKNVSSERGYKKPSSLRFYRFSPSLLHITFILPFPFF